MDEHNTILDWLVFQRLPQQSHSNTQALLSCFHSPRQLFNSEQLAGLPPLMQDCIRQLQQQGQSHVLYQQALRLCEQASALAVEIISIDDARYPDLLKEIHQAPLVLYVKGAIACLNQPQLAVVGARKASALAKQVSQQWCAALAQSGLCITSGLAIGIDGAAHQGALDGQGQTIAVLANGLDRCYPAQHRYLADAILANQGALLSEFAFGEVPRRAYFPQRNRIISGLSMAVWVVEAALQSGSLITARLAMEQGRDVFAMPSSINNVMAKGCHQLIKQGALLVENCDDILQALALPLCFSVTSEPEKPSGLSNYGETILAAMGHEVLHIDEIQALCSLDSARLASELLLLELDEKVLNQNGYYQKV